MYTPTKAQLETETRFTQKGYGFLNWIPYTNDESYPHGTMVMVKRINAHRAHYVEIDPNGDAH